MMKYTNEQLISDHLEFVHGKEYIIHGWNTVIQVPELGYKRVMKYTNEQLISDREVFVHGKEYIIHGWNTVIQVPELGYK